MAIQPLTLDSSSINAIGNLLRAHRGEMTGVIENMINRISGSGMGSSMGLSGMRRGSNQEEYKDELEKFLKVVKKVGQTLSATEKYQKDAAERELASVKRRIQADRDAAAASEQNTDAQDENTDSNERNTDALRTATDQLGQWARGLAAGTLSFQAVSRAVNEFEQAYKTGLNWNALSDTLHSAFTMGLSPKDMMDFQAKFRRVSNTFENGISDFTAIASANQVQWMKYTGNLKEAAFMQGEFTDVAMSMGLGIKDVNGAVNTLFERFKNLQAVTSMTAEQFVAIQRSMLAEQSVRDKLVGLQGKERLNYLSGLTQTNMAFRMMGMQQDVADRLVKFIEAQSTKGARSRLKEGAQLSIVAQTLGMGGDQAQRLAELHRKRNKTPEDQAEYAKLGQMLKEAQERYRGSGQYNQGIASGEYLVDALGQIAPILNEIGNASAEGILTQGAAAQSSAIAKQQAEIADRNEGLQGKIIESIVKFSNVFSAWGASALAALVGGTWAAARFGRGLRGGGGPGAGPGGGPGGAGGMAGRLWGGIGRYGRAGVMGLGVGIAGGVAQAIADPQSDEKKNIWNSATAGASLGAALGSVVPGLGTIAGGSVGGLLGIGYALLDNQGVFEDAITSQKNAIIEQTNAADLKFKFEQEYFNKELARLEEIGKTKEGMDRAQLARYDELKKAQDTSKKEYEASSAKNAADSFAYDARNIVNAQNSFKEVAQEIGSSWGHSYGTTGEVNSELKNIQGRLGMAGVNMSDDELRGKIAASFQQVLMEKNINTDDSRKTWEALRSGGNYDYDNGDTNPLIAEAMARITPDLVAKMNDSLSASVSERFTSTEQLGSLQANIETIQKQVEQDKQLIELAKSNPQVGAGGLAEAAQKRLEENQNLAGLLQQLVNDKTVKIDGDTTELFSRMAESLDKIAGGKQFSTSRSRA